MMPPNLVPTGMGGAYSGSNPMTGSMAGRPPMKPNVPPVGMVGMSMPANLNPISQMSFASGMRPAMNPNPMMGSNPMGNPMGNPMINPMGGNQMGGNPMMNPMMMMGGKMGLPMGNQIPNPMGASKPYAPSFTPADKKPTGESDK